MRARSVVGALLFLSLPAHHAIAAIHLTDISGREVTIVRGAASPRAARVATSGHRTTPQLMMVNAGPDTDAANNDYRRIQNALNAATNGSTIILNGTFDFTAPFAAAAWALGNDNTASTADDYEVLVPNGLSDVALTAISLGSATIQGPGDLAAVNLESFLVFDGGPNPGWWISNLRILDFDLSIGMFASAATDFNFTRIQNNFIRIPNDLNATVAPADVNQNIGLHFSFGTNQSITGNSFQVPGDGVSNGANTSSTVVMQSNTGVGNTYDRLNIANNVIHVINAQSANPQTTIGIWDNGHAHTSNITISNNSFLNDAAGNSPALNVERAFRVTSHSGAASTVTYDSNQMSGANIGIQWLTGANFTGNQAVILTNNQVTNCDTGVLVQSNGIAHLATDVITGSGAGAGVHVITGMLTAAGANTNSIFRSLVSGGSADGVWIEATAGAIAPMSQNDLRNNTGFGLRNDSAPSIIAELNFWGSNLAAGVAAEVSGNADFDPWLSSGTDVSGTLGFQPFIYATTSGTTTTFVGTAVADDGSVVAGDPVTLTMDGETGRVPLAQLLSLDIQVGAGDDFFRIAETGVPTTTFDGGPGNDSLLGSLVPFRATVGQTWNITGAGSGNVPGAMTSFSNVERLVGSNADDSFVFGAGGTIALNIDGSLGVDSLDNSAIPGHTVTPTGPGTLDGFKGTATGTGTGFNNISVYVFAEPADLAVTKSGPASAIMKTVISYTITVTNNGPNPAINASLTDPIPSGTTFASVVSPAGWSCTTPLVFGSGKITCTNASAPLGSSIFTLNINGPPVAATVMNTATVTSVSVDPTPVNNRQTVTTDVIALADVSITKTAAPSPPYTTGGPVTYSIVLVNHGPAHASGVVVTDILPPGTTLESTATPTQGSCSGVTTVTCTIGEMYVGDLESVAVRVMLPSTAGPVSNTATVATSSTDTNPANNSSTSTITVIAASAIPAASPLMLALLALVLATLGFFALRNSM